jgi:hypothetical protein
VRRRPRATDENDAELLAMTDERRFGELLMEFERVGVDPNSFPAGITVRPEEAMRILRSLPDDAGPGAFLARIRENQQARHTPPGSQEAIEVRKGA